MSGSKGEGRAVLVTGAGRRIGRHIAQGLAADGWHVAVHFRSSEAEAEAVARGIRDAGGQAATVQADLADADSCRALVGRAADALGRPLSALVNNASAFRADSADGLSEDGLAAWALNMDVNLRAPLLLSEQFARQVPVGVPGGACIVHLIDQRVLKPNPLYFSYTLSKAALHWAVKTQAQDFAPRGIRVVGVGPGPTLENVDQAPGEFDAEAAATLLGHGSPPAQIVAAVRYLLGATSVTGQMIAVDAGQHLTWQTPDLLVGEAG